MIFAPVGASGGGLEIVYYKPNLGGNDGTMVGSTFVVTLPKAAQVVFLQAKGLSILNDRPAILFLLRGYSDQSSNGTVYLSEDGTEVGMPPATVNSMVAFG